MTSFNTSALTGRALDKAVAIASGRLMRLGKNDTWYVALPVKNRHDKCIRGNSILLSDYRPSAPGYHVCNLLYEEGITVGRQVNSQEWTAEAFDGTGMDVIASGYGPTPFIAISRCYVQLKLGSVVEIDTGIQ